MSKKDECIKRTEGQSMFSVKTRTHCEELDNRACALLQQQTARATASCVTHTTSSLEVDWEKKETALHLSNPPLSDYWRLHHSDNDL